MRISDWSSDVCSSDLWDPSMPWLDPFCGGGTILIEAAWIALGVPAGIWRPFGFERLRNHDSRHWRDIKDEARSHIATRLDSPIVGCDLNPQAIEAAKANRSEEHQSELKSLMRISYAVFCLNKKKTRLIKPNRT